MSESPLPEELLRLPIKEAKRQFVKLYIEQLLHECDGHVTKAAAHCGLNRRTIHRVMTENGIDPKIFRKRGSRKA